MQEKQDVGREKKKKKKKEKNRKKEEARDWFLPHIIKK